MPTPLLPFRSSHCGCASVVSICACVLAVTAGCASDSEPTSSTSSSRAAAPANTSATAFAIHGGLDIPHFGIALSSLERSCVYLECLFTGAVAPRLYRA